MKTYNPGVVVSIQSTADLTKFRFVGFDGSHCGNGAKALGVTEVDYKNGEVVGLITTGIALVEAGGNVSVGAKLQSDANGKAITYASGEVNGYSLDSGASGDLIRVKLI